MITQSNITLHTSLQELRQNINQMLEPQKTWHPIPHLNGWAIGFLLWRSEKIDCVITALHCVVAEHAQSWYDTASTHTILTGYDTHYRCLYVENLTRACFNLKTVFPIIGISIIKTRPGLICMMGMFKLVRWQPYIEMAPTIRWPINHTIFFTICQH